MCGIIGYVGKEPAGGILADGLSALQYRGYDSAGIALCGEDGLVVVKAVGKLADLFRKLDRDPVPKIGTGIGHTRWATHGRPSEANAHPHVDCTSRIAIVHNGIIENLASLRHHLARAGHRLVTETDSELIAHLVEEESGHRDFPEAVRRAVARLKGAFAIVCMTSDDPSLLVAARSGPPLVVGYGEGEMLVASDIPALVSRSSEMAYLGDREVAVVSAQGCRFVTFGGAPAAPRRQQIDWDVARAEKGGYLHFMLKEIMEQPEALRETLVAMVSPERDRIVLPEEPGFEERVSGFKRAQFIACGTSYHAAMIGKRVMERVCRTPSQVEIASEYRYRDPIIGEDCLAVFLTQSGETADTLAALREAVTRGAYTVVVTNVRGSMATRECRLALVTRAGPEIGVAATKTFTTQLLMMRLLALAVKAGRLPSADCRRELETLFRLPQLVESALHMIREDHGGLSEIASAYADSTGFLYLGRGDCYPIAFEGALKIKEIAYLHAEGYAAGEMKHGPIALVDATVPVVALVPSGRLREKMLGNIQEVKARDGIVIAICEQGDREVTRLADRVIEIPRTPAELIPIVMAIPVQLLAYEMAIVRGTDVDKPRNLAKSVTVE